jgi:malonyl-CoA O-methyltransferase
MNGGQTTPRGVFVTGTDTGVGKTVAAACLVRAWGADYWKPAQTGLADEPGDSATVAALAGLPAGRVLPPRVALRAPLAPAAAAALEGVAFDLADFTVPPRTGHRPLVVEGAGGVLVPLTAEALIIDLIARLGLPVVVVARSSLGTINHTLLTLEALRSRALPVAGVILNGPADAGNRAAIERFGRVRVLAELPALPRIDADAVARLAERLPPLELL